MSDESVWVHGTSVRIQNPENLVAYNAYGWGTDVIFRQPDSRGVPDSWFHASIPSTVPLHKMENTYLLSIEILFLAIHCKLDLVDVYDGSTFVESPAWRHLDGEWRFKKGNDKNWNKYILERPHPVFCGIGVSFHVYADNGPFPGDDVRLIVASVGANFRTEGPKLTDKVGMRIALEIGP
jgi:hypothetical protein